MTSLLKHSKKIKSVLILLFYTLALYLSWIFIFSKFDRQLIQDYFSTLGPFGPAGLVLLLIIFSIFPFYNTPLMLASGFLYGPYGGFLVNFWGIVLGQLLVIFLVKRYGKPLVEKAVKKDLIEKYTNLVDKYGLWTLYFVYVLPGLPDDAFTYLIALSHIKTTRYLPVVFLGTIPKSAISFIGDDPLKGILPFLITRVAFLILGGLAFLYLVFLKNFFTTKK